jgi:hypothetical protein
VHGGLRAGELWTLRPERVNVLAATIDVVESLSEVRGEVVVGPTKTGRRRTVTVPRFLAEMIGAHMGNYSSSEYVFTAAQGGPVRHRNLMRRHFTPATAAAGLDGLRFHDLRHTCAALLVATAATSKRSRTTWGTRASGSRPTITGTCSRGRGSSSPIRWMRRSGPRCRLPRTFRGLGPRFGRYPTCAKGVDSASDLRKRSERTTGFEPATLTLAR